MKSTFVRSLAVCLLYGWIASGSAFAEEPLSSSTAAPTGEAAPPPEPALTPPSDFVEAPLDAPLAEEGAPEAPAALAFAPEPPVELSADALEYDAEREVYIARGNVRIAQEGKVLKADWAAFSRKSGRGVASGNVLYETEGETVQTAFVDFDIESLDGVMFDARFQPGDKKFRVSAGEVARTGDKQYLLRKGEFTTCNCPDPEAEDPWKVTAGELKLVDGVGYAKNTAFEILGVPVFWLPWMMYPLQKDRQSGLLFPKVGYSGRNGAEIGVPIFLALGDPVNLTVTPTWLQKRGFFGDAEVEYVLGQESGGRAAGYFISDGDIDPDTRETPYDDTRWATRGQHDLHLPGELRARTDYAFASDNDFPWDFDPMRSYRYDRFLGATAFVGRDFGATGLASARLGARFADDLQAPDDTDRDDFLMQRLPELDASIQPSALPFAQWLVPAVDFSAVRFDSLNPSISDDLELTLVTSDGHFYDTGTDGLANDADGFEDDQEEQGRKLGIVGPNKNRDDFGVDEDGTEGDGKFQEGELLADRGYRMSLTPRLAAPLRFWDALELMPEVGWYQTFYDAEEAGGASRGLATARLDLRTRLRGELFGMRHLLEPQLGWVMVEEVAGGSQQDNPLFTPRGAILQQRLRQLDLDNVTRDPSDRIEEENAVLLAFNNRFYRGGGEGEGPRLAGDLVFGGRYSIEDSDFANLVLDGRAYPTENTTVRTSIGFDPEAGRFDETYGGFAWESPQGHAFGLAYRYLREIPDIFERYPEENDRFDDLEDNERLHQLDAVVRTALTAQWAVTFNTSFSIEDGRWWRNIAGIEYLSRCDCWAGRLELGYTHNGGIRFGVQYRLLGFGDDLIAPFDLGLEGAGFEFLSQR